MFVVKGFFKGIVTTGRYETEEEARSEGMKFDGDVFMREGEDGFPILLKESEFEIGKEYTFRQYGTGKPGIAKLISLDGINAVIDVLKSEDWGLIGIQRGKLTSGGGSITVKRGLSLYAHCPL